MAYEYQRRLGNDSVDSENDGADSSNGEAGPVTILQTAHSNGSHTVTVNWGGVALAGLTGAFLWWYFKKFLPGMEAASQREQALEANSHRLQGRF